MHIRDLPKVEAVLKDSTGKVDFVVVRFENYKRFVRKCNVEGKIDEADYMARYKDVEKSISEGKCRTATEHYLNTGYVEQRLAKLAESDEPSRPASAPVEEVQAAEVPATEDVKENTVQESDNDEREPPRSGGYGRRSARSMPRMHRAR